jgi:hypothetical protein
MSLASVVSSYFLIAGGTFFAALVTIRAGIHSEYLGYLILAAGGFLGGIVAARASKGSTIIEPAIGAVLLIASVVGLGLAASGRSADTLVLPSTMKAIALTAAAMGGGGIVGAYLSEKMFGEATTSSVPWILYIAMAAFGAGIMGTIIAAVLTQRDAGPVFGLLALCTLLVGIAAGASARSRPLGAAFLGGAIGVGGYFLLAVYMFAGLLGGKGSREGIPSEVYAGIGVVAVGAGIVALLGALIGWATVGSKQG